jgi:phage terminase small subunit
MLAIDGLTARQEAFCQNILQGMTQVDAYIAAGYSDNQDRNSQYINASQLANDAKVVLRLTELKALADAQLGLSMGEKRAICKEIASNDGNRPRDRLQAIDIDNKQTRVYAETPQIQGNVQINVIAYSQDTKPLVDRLLGRGEVVEGELGQGSKELPLP